MSPVPDTYAWPADPDVTYLFDLIRQLRVELRDRVHATNRDEQPEVDTVLKELAWRVGELEDQARRRINSRVRARQPTPAGTPLDPAWPWEQQAEGSP